MVNIPREFTSDMSIDREYDMHHRADIEPTNMVIFHAHDHYEIYMYISGNMDIAIEENLYRPQMYDLFIYAPGMMHRWIPRPPVGRYERAYLYMRRRTLSELSTPDLPIYSIIENAVQSHVYTFHPGPHKGPQLLQLMDEIHHTLNSTDPVDQVINRCRLNILLADICRIIERRGEETPSIPNRMHDIILYINQHLTESITLDELASRFFVSKYYLLHAFKDYTNLSVHQYIIARRIIAAQHMLKEGLPPGTVAQQCGFNDYAGFYRAFVKQTGTTPQAFSKRKHSDAHLPNSTQPSSPHESPTT